MFPWGNFTERSLSLQPQIWTVSGLSSFISTNKLSLSEVLSIMVLFHLLPYKDFWRYGMEEEFCHCSGEIPSDSRLVALAPHLLFCPQHQALAVCHNPRISPNRVFQGVTQWDHTSTGCFFGFNLHLHSNHQGQIRPLKITGGIPMPVNCARI